MGAVFPLAGALLVLLEVAGAITQKTAGYLPVGGSHIAQVAVVLGLAFVVHEVIGASKMAVQNRISVSFNDEEFHTLERLSAHTQKTKAELIRTIVEEFLRENPNRF